VIPVVALEIFPRRCDIVPTTTARGVPQGHAHGATGFAMNTIEQVLNRIRAEYLEMPGMTLTSHQLQRLCGIDGQVCTLVLDALVNEKFLRVRTNGTFARLTDGSAPRPLPAKATLGGQRRVWAAS
jgi:hypothetical protein